MGEELPKAVYREPLADTREAIKKVKKLMKSETEDVRVIAVNAFLQLSSLAAALAEALGEAPERERNPLSRRFRGIDIEGGGGSIEWLRKTFVFRNGLRDSIC